MKINSSALKLIFSNLSVRSIGRFSFIWSGSRKKKRRRSWFWPVKMERNKARSYTFSRHNFHVPALWSTRVENWATLILEQGHSGRTSSDKPCVPSTNWRVGPTRPDNFKVALVWPFLGGGGGGVLPYSLDGGVPLGSRKSWSLPD